MADVSKLANREMTTKQKVINTLAIFAGVAVIIALMKVFNVGAWVPFLTLVLWAAQGIKLGVRDVAEEFIGIFVGLAMGYLVQHASTLGTWAIVVFGVLVVLLFVVMVNRIKPLMLFFNNYTAAFCTVGTALSYELTIGYDYLFTLVLFGILPLVGVTIADKVKAKKAAQSEAEAE